MSYANYENNIISAESEIFTAERIARGIEETAILLVTKSLAEANAEEILDIVLDNAFDHVCLQTPGYIQLCDYDKPIVTTPSLGNILSVLEMESNFPVQQKTKNYYHSDHSNESGDESAEEPVFTSPIYVKSGPENINILQEISTAKSCHKSECAPDVKQQPQESDRTADIKNEAHENISEPEELSSEGNHHIRVDSDFMMNTDCHPCENLSKSQISEKEDTEYLENIGDANDTINADEKIEPKSSTSGQIVSLAGKVIGDVVTDLNISHDEEIQVQPQVVQTYVLYPGGPAKAEDIIMTRNENSLATELEGDALDQSSLNKDEDTSSSTNETNVETPLAANEVGDLLNYFEQVNNTVDLRVQIVSNVSDERVTNNRICEEVKRAVKEIAAAVFEGQGDGTSTELSNLSIQLANRQEQKTSEIQDINPVQLQSMDQPRSTHMDSEKSQSTLNSDGEEVIAVHETLSVDSDLQDFLSEMHMQDEMDEREVQIIHRDDEGETESLNGAAFNSDYPQCSNYLAASGMASQDEVDDFSYRSGSEINLSLKKSYLDTTRITQVVEEPYSLQTMVRNMKKKNPNAKINLAIGKTRSSRQALGPIKIQQSSEEFCNDENAEDTQKNAEDTPLKIRESRWRRVRNMLTCFKSRRQSSDEL